MENNYRITLDINGVQSDDRNLIMHISTQIETFISTLLNMSIGNFDNSSISFGYTSQSLSLNARINLLIDYNIFSKDEKACLVKFMEIRNKFAHNANVKSLCNYLLEEENTETLNYLEKKFKSKIYDYGRYNDDIWKLFHCLIHEIEIALTKFKNKLNENAGQLGELTQKLNFLKCLKEVIHESSYYKNLPNHDQEVIKSLIKETNNQAKLRVDTRESALERMKGKRFI